MNDRRNPIDPDQLFDEAVAAVRDEPVDSQAFAAAQARVSRRLEAELAAAPAESLESDTEAESHRIHGCEGFQSLIPAYLAGALSEPKRILFEDHTRECVPCRRALNEAKKAKPRVAQVARGSAGRRFAWKPLAMAAGLAAAVAAGVFVTGRLGLVGPDATAKVKAIDGELVLVASGVTTPISAGATIERGQLVRTASGSSAVLALADGTEVELAERTELALARRSDGVVVGVERGEVIVEAAEQKSGHLYVTTEDMTVSVIGTIFAVDHGVRGSRVAVLDGEVHVEEGARLAVLRPGDQLATERQLRRVSLESEFGWSRNSADYRERIAALAALGRELDQTLAVPASRTSTRLLDLAPADTAIWVALPNLSDQLGDAWELLERRVSENPVLADWWAEKLGGSSANAAEIGDAIDRLRSLGHGLGAEIAVAVSLDPAGECGTPVVLAEIADRGFVGTLDAEIERLNAQAAASGHGEVIRRVASPSEAGSGEGLWIWIAADDLLVASPTDDGLRRIESALAAGGGFAGSPFHSRLAEVYADGAGWLLGVDAGRVLASKEQSEGDRTVFEQLGLASAEQFIVEGENENGVTQSRATLGFSGPRRGVASWLAAPASSEALEFVSANAQFATQALVKRPTAMFDDLWNAILAEEVAAGQATAKRSELEQKLGFSLRDDFAAAFGGDFAFAIDGPWLPKPSWKVVAELADAGGLAAVADRAIDALNAELQADGKPGLKLAQEESDGRVYFHLTTDAGVDLAFASVVDGYLVVAPSKALIVEAIAHRAAGTTLARSKAFLDRLPNDADPDFSAMAWQNLGATLGQLGQLLSGEGTSGITPEIREQMETLATESGPTLVVAYGERDRIGLVAQGLNGPLGFSFERILSILGAVAGGPGADSDGSDESDAPASDETPVQTSA